MNAATNLPPDINRADTLRATAITLLAIAIIMVTLRTSVRIFITKSLGWDDYLMLMGLLINQTLWILNIAKEGTSIAATYYGVGRHIYYLSAADAVMVLKLNTIGQPLNLISFFFVKASILALILRLKPKPMFKWILYIMLALMVVIIVTGVFISFAQCQPFAKNWDTTIPGTCWSHQAFINALYALQAITIFSDLCYMIIPIFILWDLQMPREKKLSVLGMIGVGCVSMVCSIAAIPFAQDLSASIDVSWTIVNLASVKIGEINIAIIVGCIPPIHPLFNKLRDCFAAPKLGMGETYEARLARLKLQPSEYAILQKERNGCSQGSANRRGPSVSQMDGSTDDDAMVLQEHGVPARRPEETV
ncbi:hypothetical protein BO94DRAFT_587395 [Aspergillus sclerotioniger CBS 115572]|uniref:Rhodopsin domain-containing protein n=1 Tax=Aspergillus sclerotioniger CBS 115572 TaxID=1450535 RepID=A0A317W7P5_9EURO|nr:hypothetical protein BO94DRAFT_587395 [Aspergillus sclerotioniger CBS 115572]PWY81691.1 hypothetical protein BO94DRAFT_587395 [Aspergillus sclerotioniger CBS 115572]